jgi:hypothetical protein
MIYGISQDPNTKDYIVVFRDIYCEKCSEKYTDISNKWCKSCKPCQIKDLTNLISSGSEKVDNFIQVKQIEFNYFVCEWIPYNQFNNIKKMYENNFFITYSAIWINGPLYWEPWNKKFNRKFDGEVYLIHSHILQSVDKFLNEV